MPAPTNTLLIEGSFAELSEELAQYIDNINKVEGDKGVQAEIAPTLEQLRSQEQSEEAFEASHQEQIVKARDDVLKKLVSASTALNAAPEKGAILLLRI